MKGQLETFLALSFGIVAGSQRFLVLMATEDMVAGTLIPSSIVLILFSTADMLSKILSPFLIRKISILATTLLIGIMWLTSYLLIVLADDVNTRLAGVFVYGVENGFLTVAVVFMIARSKDVERNTSAWQVGGNIASIVVGLLYTGSTVWQCFSPRITIVIFYPIGALLIVIIPTLSRQIDKNAVYTPYTPVPSDENVKIQSDNTSRTNTPIPNITVSDDDDDENYNKQNIKDTQNTMNTPLPNSPVPDIPVPGDENKTKVAFKFFHKTYPFAAIYFFNFFCFFLASNAVLTVLTFPSAPFLPRDHFQYYRLSGDIGTVFGALELMVVSCLCPQFLNFVRNCKLWPFVLASVAHLIFFLFASWYRFVPSVYIILVLCGTHGVLFGTLAVRTLESVADSFVNASDSGLAMSITEVGCSLGRLVAGIIGIFVEEYLRNHCTNELLMGRTYCLARFHLSVGWSENLQC